MPVISNRNDHNSGNHNSKDGALAWITIFPCIFIFCILMFGVRSQVENHKRRRLEEEELKREGEVAEENLRRWEQALREERAGPRPMNASASLGPYALDSHNAAVAVVPRQGRSAPVVATAPQGIPWRPANTVLWRNQTSGRSQTQSSGQSSPGRVSAEALEPVAQPLGRARIDNVEQSSQNRELPPSYEARIRDELYREEDAQGIPPEPSAPPYVENDPLQSPAGSQGGEEVQPLEVNNDASTREAIFVRRDDAGSDWLWNGNQLIISGTGVAQ